MKKIGLPPNPKALVESLRDIGYSLETAIADIIDNSITANAKLIDVRFSWNGGDPWFAVIDDGYGMSNDELVSAMRFGSKNPLEERSTNDLGRFGLGLKTASFSQCKCLTVVSKRTGNTSCARWDLDSISSSKGDDWSLLLLSEDEIKSERTLLALVNEYLDTQDTGSIVFWSKVDRLESGTAKRSGEARYNDSIHAARTHLELIYHRFLLPSFGKSKISIRFNHGPLEAFDPFNSKKSAELRKEEFFYEGQPVTVQPYILPHHNKVSKPEWKKYSGRHGYLQEQGFYVYRNRRLIIYSTWFKLIPKQELTKLLRVKVDMTNSFDQFWKIDVKKSHASPPAEVRDNLKRIIGKIEFSGKGVYKQKGQKVRNTVKVPAWERIAKENQIFYRINKAHPLLNNLAQGLEPHQAELFTSIISMLENSFPRESYYSDLASAPEELNNLSLKKEQIIQLLRLFSGDEKARFTKNRIQEILYTDPFASNKSITIEVLREEGYEL
ncbi:MAG: ATP-binding protein [Gammaproteobacteria bacterium]|nr:ATP-binding protein [Gammaproteobacteria bacterium]